MGEAQRPEPTPLHWGAPFAFGYYRNFVADLGDVDGDGFEDFATITGINTNGPTGPVCTPQPSNRMLIKIYTAMPDGFGDAPPPILAPFHPGLRGNKASQIGKHVFVQVYNARPGDVVWLFEWPSLEPPRAPCSGELHEVYDPAAPDTPQHGPYTADANGEVAILLPLDYDPSLVGQQRYFQARADASAGPPALPCRISPVRRVALIDLSNPRWTFSR